MRIVLDTNVLVRANIKVQVLCLEPGSTAPCAQLHVTGLLPRPMADVNDLDQPVIFVDSIVNQQRAVE
jgi:hypothetical protein